MKHDRPDDPQAPAFPTSNTRNIRRLRQTTTPEQQLKVASKFSSHFVSQDSWPKLHSFVPGRRNARGPIPSPAMTYSRTHDQQHDASNHRQPSKYRRQGNALVSFCGDVHRSHIDHVFLTRVVDALIGERSAPKTIKTIPIKLIGFISASPQ